jgi:hypothetical protein
LDHGEDLSPLSLDDSGYNKQDHLAIVDPYELVGRTFLMDPQDDGQCFRARIVDLVKDHQSKVRKLNHHHKFRILVNDDQYEEVITYNELMDFIQKNEENDAIVWRFWRIVGHQGDKICMMMTRLACNRAIESLYWRMDNNSDVNLLMGYVLYQLPIELESMDLDTFSH